MTEKLGPFELGKVHVADCVEAMARLPENSVDAIVTDPPYGLGFMGKKWDALPPGPAVAEAMLRVLKPGGHVLAFGGTRTFHRLTCALEDAGLEIRDSIDLLCSFDEKLAAFARSLDGYQLKAFLELIAPGNVLSWLYGSGFPKSLDVSKAIDKAAGAEREVVGPNRFDGINGKANATCYGEASRPDATAPATPAAKRWDGWGTALKPAWEPVIMARKPLAGTVAANVLEHGCGGINVDGCRVEHGDPEIVRKTFKSPDGIYQPGPREGERGAGPAPAGRWPANVVLDPEAAAMLDADEAVGGQGRVPQAASGGSGVGGDSRGRAGETHNRAGEHALNARLGYQAGGASRFFYCAKASRGEREAGLDGFAARQGGVHDDDGYREPGERKANHTAPGSVRNHNPTVKPIDLMRWLCTLVTPPGGIVLDPFAGSGTTGCALVWLEGARFLGFEKSDDYAAIANARIAYWAEKAVGADPDTGQGSLFGEASAEKLSAAVKNEVNAALAEMLKA